MSPFSKSLLNEAFWKIYMKFTQKFKTFSKTFSGIKFNKIQNNLRNFQIVFVKIYNILDM